MGISILVHFNTILNQILPEVSITTARQSHESISGIIGEVSATFLVTFCLFLLNYYIIQPINRPRRLSVLTILLVVCVSVIAVTALSDVFFWIKRLLVPGNAVRSFNLLYTFRDLFIAFMVMICVLMIRSVKEKQIILIENERLIRENLQSQYESLKNQVSPHFLFNSLTALKTLIGEDAETARLYLNHLSQVLRHTLQSNEYRTVCLSDEMEVVHSYLFLIKMRFDASLMITFDIHEKYNNFRLPPLAIQTLIENAVKHNEISRRNPMQLRIVTSEKPCLVVTNSLREKFSREPGTGIGLSNLSRQYKLLCGRDIDIFKDAEIFRVELPLLNPQTDDSPDRGR
jgi:sensor histidine kinase YesM